MADYRDVMSAESQADTYRKSVDAYGGAIEDGRTADPALAVLLAAGAICTELRHLATRLDYLAHEVIGGR